MTRSQIGRELERVSGTKAFITAAQLESCFDIKTPGYLQRKYLEGLDRIDGKYYFIPDVAARLMERVIK